MTRIGHTVSLQDLTDDEWYAAQVERVTGRTLGEWAAEEQERRQRDFGTRFHPRRWLTTDEMCRAARAYGLDAPDDWHCQIVAIDMIPSARPFVCPESGRQATKQVAWKLNPEKYPI